MFICEERLQSSASWGVIIIIVTGTSGRNDAYDENHTTDSSEDGATDNASDAELFGLGGSPSRSCKVSTIPGRIHLDREGGRINEGGREEGMREYTGRALTFITTYQIHWWECTHNNTTVEEKEDPLFTQ